MNKPLYIFKKGVFKELFYQLSKYAIVYYPIKTNDSEFVINSLISYGSRFEVDTVEHVKLLIKQYHVLPGDILFNAILRSKEELETVIKYGVTYFALDSITTLETLNSFNIPFRFILRLGISEIVSSEILIMKKWGIRFSDVKLFLIFSRKYYNAEFDGYSFYLSDEGNTIEYRQKMIKKIFSELVYLPVKTINIGGSVPVDEMESYTNAIKEFGNYNIIVEPGRPLLNQSIDLLSSIIEVRNNKNDSSFAYINVGIYNGMIDTIIKNRHFNLSVIGKHTNKTKRYLVCGPTGDLIDNLGFYDLPEDISVGDDILIHDCGAYCQVLITPFYRFSEYDVKIIE